jgi:TonB family protein
MPHGIDAYFEELARTRRRTGTCGAIVALVAVALEFGAMRPGVVASLNDPRRFGFEGREQYVRRILLEAVGETEQAGSQAQNIVPVDLRRGGEGGEGGPRTKATGLLPAPLQGGGGPGDDAIDLQTRLRALALQGPIIRSEDLVVEKLVQPEYPEAAREADIEGVVELVARVDTTGAVTEVHIVGGTRHPLLDQAATTAVLQCVYRPYRVRDTAESVWAFFRIKFRLY